MESYTYYEFEKQIRISTLLNCLKPYSDRFKITPVSIWDRKFLLSEIKSNDEHFVEDGSPKKLKYKVKKTNVERQPNTRYCSCCRKYISEDQFGILKNGEPRKTCIRCKR
jgi:hypothetical protein